MAAHTTSTKLSSFQETLRRFSAMENQSPPLATPVAAVQQRMPCPSRANSNSLPPPSSVSSSPKSPWTQESLPRSPRASSLDARASTPNLLRKASMTSLHGIGGVTPPRPSPSRRSSSTQFLNGSTMIGGNKSPLSEIEIEPPPQHTAASIAQMHFEKDLALHEEDAARHAETVVILHDACYGHRYSRPRTSKASLSTIVERPERIQASILGLSVAYVRLGQRHAEGAHPLHPDLDPATLRNAVPFRIRKTTRQLALSSQAVTNVHGTKWMEELKIMCDSAESKLAMNGKELTRPEMTRSPNQDAPARLHEGDLYLCSESLDAMEGALGAVCEGVDAVFRDTASEKGPSRAFVAIRPPGHHCSASYPSGFCWLNNVHVGISHAALTHGLTHAAIIDFDLHHGDGSQAITWEHNRRASGLAKNALPWKRTSIAYFSLHDINSYPCEMGDEEKVKNASLCIENAHGQSIWNVHLQPWKSENEFWELYDTKYSVLLEKTRTFLRAQTERFGASTNGPRPKAAIFLSAGFDASEWESSGMQRHKVNVPTEFYARLTRDVVRIANEEGTSVNGRVISVLEGGYSDRALYTGVFSHLSGLACAAPVTVTQEMNNGGPRHEMSQRTASFTKAPEVQQDTSVNSVPKYDPEWWSSQCLEQLDAIVKPPPLLPEPRKSRDSTLPTYSSPTQSFIAKVSSPKAQRAVSNMSNGSPRPVSRVPSPPPPQVDWAVAAYELSKLLIPSNRQTSSCRPEDLSAEATRARRDRQSILTPAVSEPASVEKGGSTRMALRTRKTAKPIIETLEEDGVRKSVSRTSRRKTVAGAAILADKAPSRSTTPIPVPSYTRHTAQSNRRLSLVSNTDSIASESDSSRVSGHGQAPSVRPTSASQYPGISTKIRPDSSMNTGGHSIPPMVVKKMRAPPRPQDEAPSSSQVQRKSPSNDTFIGAPMLATSSCAEVNGAALPDKEITSQASDIDSLTAGMKKVKLSLTTKAQREAKELAKATTKPSKKAVPPKSAKSRPPASTPSQPVPTPGETTGQNRSESSLYSPPNERLQAHPNLEKLVEDVKDELPAPQSDTPTFPSPQNIQPPSQQEPDSHVEDAKDIPLPSSPLPVLSPKSPAQSIALRPAPDIFVPYQAEGPTPDPIPQQEPLRWLPPDTTVTPTPMKRSNFPVFTSTSAIPFAPNPRLGALTGSGSTEPIPTGKIENEDSVWDVPETPRK